MTSILDRLSINAGQPIWLVLILVCIPPIIFFSLKSLSGLGKPRRALAILLRSIVVILLILALARLQSVRTNDRMTTLFLLDVSQSLPQEWRRPMINYVNQAVRSKKKLNDQAGVVVFAKDARIEVPPTPEFNRIQGLESQFENDFTEHTDLATAIKLALATFPEDTARRIVILTDGNENRGNVIEQAAAARQLGVRIDVVPIEYKYDREVLVEKVMLPPDVKEGETVNINVVIRASEPTTGKLQIFQKADNYSAPAPGNEQPVPVSLPRGLTVKTLRQKITQPNFYTFKAEFTPDEGTGDRRAVNNVAEGFTHARGTAQALLIEGTRGEHEELVRALREKGIAVTVMVAPRIDGSGEVGGDAIPTELAQLQPFDTVILANAPKESFTEAQQQMLEANVHDMGAGLVMIGGPNSFGAGGWMNTPVEKALPVDMQIKAMRVMGKSALVLIMHASEIAEGNYWQKVIAQQAIKTLSTYDYVGLIHWEGQEAWLFSLREIGGGRMSMLRAIDRMTPGDMPDFDPSLQLAMNGLMSKKDAMTKHIIIISDGDPTPPTAPVVNRLAANKITVTAVLTAAHGNDLGATNVMVDLAKKTKGRFYNVTNPKALPRIYQKEARLISRPLIFEQKPGWTPNVQYLSEPITGIPTELPGITGLVLTSLKENELVEMPITSPLPTGQTNPVLAHWSYGLGKSVAFTSDAGKRWTTNWTNWDSYAAFWSQVVRWSMRPVEKGNLTMALKRDEGKIKVVVDALDKDNQFLNFLQMQGVIVRPDLTRATVELSQTAPGHYEATIPAADASGNYFVNVGYRGGKGVQGVLSSGVSVPYSEEYRELRSNPESLKTVASLAGGEVFDWVYKKNGDLDLPAMIAQHNVFERAKNAPPPKTFRDLWPDLLWLAAIVFLADVAVRRVAPIGIGFASRSPTATNGFAGKKSLPRRNTSRNSRTARPTSTNKSKRPGRPPVSFRPPCPPRLATNQCSQATLQTKSRESQWEKPSLRSLLPNPSPKKRAIPTVCSKPNKRSGKIETKAKKTNQGPRIVTNPQTYRPQTCSLLDF